MLYMFVRIALYKHPDWKCVLGFIVGVLTFSYCGWLHSRIYLHNQPWSHDHWNTKILFALTWAEVFCTCPCILLLDRKHVYKNPVFDLFELFPMHIFFLLFLLCTLCCNKWILAMRITTVESFWWVTNLRVVLCALKLYSNLLLWLSENILYDFSFS